MKVADTRLWDKHWQEVAGQPSAWDYLSQVVWQVLQSEIDGISGKSCLEAGSGSGRISRRLAAAGATVTLLDYSRSGLQFARRTFAESGIPVKLVTGDIRALPLINDSFDVVWNAGVLEHYDYREQRAILHELMRLCKPGGLLVTLNPYSRSLTYRAGIGAMEAVNRYPYGHEYHIRSVKALDDSLSPVHEYSTGFIVTLVEGYKFLPGALSSWWPFTATSGFFVRVGPSIAGIDRAFSRIFGGYLLVTVLRKNAEPRTDQC